MNSRPLLTYGEIESAYEHGKVAVWALVETQLKYIQSLETKIQELEDRLSKNSQNSSKPPSSDGLNKPCSQKPTLTKREA